MVSAYERARRNPLELTLSVLALAGVTDPTDRQFCGAAIAVEAGLSIRALAEALLGRK